MAQSIDEILSKLGEVAEEEDNLSIDDVMSAFGRKAYGPIIFVIGLITLSPIGAIPGASILFGSLLVLLMVQFIAVDKAPWIPRWIRDLSAEGSKAKSSVEKVKPHAERLGKYLKPRMETFVESPWNYAAAGLVLAMAITFFPLALVPWGVMAPSLAITIIGLALVTHDGLAMLIAFAAGIGSLTVTAWLLL